MININEYLINRKTKQNTYNSDFLKYITEYGGTINEVECALAGYKKFEIGLKDEGKEFRRMFIIWPSSREFKPDEYNHCFYFADPQYSRKYDSSNEIVPLYTSSDYKKATFVNVENLDIDNENHAFKQSEYNADSIVNIITNFHLL